MNPPIDWPLLGSQIGLGFIFGFAMGFTVRKLVKVALVVLALVLAVALALDHVQMITIHWQTLQAWYDAGIHSDGGPVHWLQLWTHQLATMIPVTGSFVLGAAWGLRKG